MRWHRGLGLPGRERQDGTKRRDGAKRRVTKAGGGNFQNAGGGIGGARRLSRCGEPG
ncbi:hypothetical protein HMPREF0972_00693 [Actinomyces sp. oral taxon 848 str. F0332]|nr:hypothetical protein HMPREF0972_00693 [Actinomyces sp. oral taxon 848 str. F0332]